MKGLLNVLASKKVLVAMAVGVLLGLGFTALPRPPEEFRRLDSITVAKLVHSEVLSWIGHGPTIYIVSNVTCPACRQRWLVDEARIKKAGDVGVWIILVPDDTVLSSRSAQAVLKAEEIGHERYVPDVWNGQSASWGRRVYASLMSESMLSEKKISEIPSSLGLRASEWNSSRLDAKCSQELRDARQAASDLGISATPSFIVRTNGGNFLYFNELEPALKFLSENEHQPKVVRFLWGL